MVAFWDTLQVAPGAQFFQTTAGTALCSHCAYSTLAWPAAFGDMHAGDRCGRGFRTIGLSQRKCSGYEGTMAELVTIMSAPARTECAWQQRVDGMRLRKPK